MLILILNGLIGMELETLKVKIVNTYKRKLEIQMGKINQIKDIMILENG